MIEIVKTFTAYPGGKKRVFAEGEQVAGLPKDDADHYVKQGLAKAVKKGRADEAE